MYYIYFHTLLVVFSIHTITCSSYDDYEDEMPPWNRCPWIRNKLKNGRVKIRSGGRIAKFQCQPGYEIAGKRFATCIRGQWNNPVPVCVARGCSRSRNIPNGRKSETYRGAVVLYDCLPGYTLVGGSATLYCDGKYWSSDFPSCVVATPVPLSCDFEDPNLCGWSHDLLDSNFSSRFFWTRNQFSTPSGQVGTGPSYDHTFGQGKGGYYLYLETSSPRKENDSAKLYSPVYSKEDSGKCFVFWYHMFGETTGGLNVYVKTDNFAVLPPPFWSNFGDQGNRWIRGNVTIPHYSSNFQIIIEGIRGSGYLGDIAIDDVSITNGDCNDTESYESGDAEISVHSCRGRCSEENNSSYCGCNDDCYENCCADFLFICTKNNETEEEGIEETKSEHFNTEIPTTASLFTKNHHQHSDNDEHTEPVDETGETDATHAETTEEYSKTFATSSPLTSLTTSSLQPTNLRPISSTTDFTTITFHAETSPSLKPTSIVFTTTSTKPTTISSTTTSTKPTTISSTTTSTKPTNTVSFTQLHPTTSFYPPTTEKLSTTTFQATPMTSSRIPDLPIRPRSTIGLPIRPRTTTTTTTAAQPITTKNPSTTSHEETTIETTTRKIYNLRPRNRTSTPQHTTVFATTAIITTSPKADKVVNPYDDHDDENTHRDHHDEDHDHGEIEIVNPYGHHDDENTHRDHHDEDHDHGGIDFIHTQSDYPLKVTASTRANQQTTTTHKPAPSRHPSKPQFAESKAANSADMDQSDSELDQSDSHASKTSSISDQSSTPTKTILTVLIIVAVVFVFGIVIMYLKKRKDRKRSKLEDDSEMRFLSENDMIEFSDASALDRININN